MYIFFLMHRFEKNPLYPRTLSSMELLIILYFQADPYSKDPDPPGKMCWIRIPALLSTLHAHCTMHSSWKRYFTLEKQSPLYRFHHWKSLLFIMIDLDPWIKKWVNDSSCIKRKGGSEKHLLYHKIQCGNCFSILKFLLFGEEKNKFCFVGWLRWSQV